jgi:hypothetical protein
VEWDGVEGKEERMGGMSEGTWEGKKLQVDERGS